MNKNTSIRIVRDTIFTNEENFYAKNKLNKVKHHKNDYKSIEIKKKNSLISKNYFYVITVIFLNIILKH